MKREQQMKRDRKWYVLHWMEGLTYGEIAKASGYHINTVANAVRRIRKEVRSRR